jgi:chaperonin GroEL
MVSKNVTFGLDSRNKILNGVNILANAVKTTLGPRGRNVIIQKPFGNPIVTKDGVTVAKEIQLEDPLEDLGAQMIKGAASKTASKSGDGTTTATVLAQAIITEGMKFVIAGVNPIELKRGIDKAVLAIVDNLSLISKPCNTPQEISQVGSISANSDNTIGSIISQAMERVGKNGAISIEAGRGLTDQLTVVSGLQFDRGYISSYFSTNHESLTTELEDCFILLYDKKISHIQPLIPVLEQVAQTGKPILIVAEEVEGDALQTLLMNNTNGSLKVCAVPAPGFSDRRLPILEDIAILTGATVFSKELCRDLSDIRIEHLGTADRIEVDNLLTTIIGGHGDKKLIQERVNHIKYQITQETDNDYNVNKLKDRLAKLDGGVAIIKVGAATEVELKEKTDRYDDALHATRAAVEEGIVPGGGVALLRAKQMISTVNTDNADQEAGVKIVLNAVESPIRQIISNAGKSPDVIIDKVLASSNSYGYDASSDTYGDMIELGIIDPTKVTKTALLNAASVAGLLLTSDCAITELPKKSTLPNREEFVFP